MDSVECRVLKNLFSELVDCIQQSPGDVLVNLKPLDILTPKDEKYLHNPANTNTQKAEKIVKVVSFQVQDDAEVYVQFIEALKASGDRIVAIVSTLEGEYKSISAELLHPEKDSVGVREHEGEQNDCVPQLVPPKTPSEQKSSLYASDPVPKHATSRHGESIEIPICGVPPIPLTSNESQESNQNPYSASAHIDRDKIWKRRGVLNVHFLNKEFLSEHGWKTGGSMMNVQNIMDWAAVWNSPGPHFDKIPKFELLERPTSHTKADIRVKFTYEAQSNCWSMVGTDAERFVTDPKEPTMVLNLTGYDQELQRSMVIHEFGHALGLEHEHQRSDFWDTVGMCFDVDKMMKGLGKDSKSTENPKEKARDAFERHWFKKSSSTPENEYDENSIMHYQFDINWLKDEYQDETKWSSLTKKTVKYLKIINEKYKSKCQLPINPSDDDIKALQKAYSNPTNLDASQSEDQDGLETVTIDELKVKVTDSQLDSQIQERDFFNLSLLFDDVDSFLAPLRLLPGQRTDIKDLSFRRGIQVAMSEALKKWRQPNPFKATYRALVNVLIDLGKGDLAIRVCDYLASK